MNKTMIKSMLMFALAILGGSVWAVGESFSIGIDHAYNGASYSGENLYGWDGAQVAGKNWNNTNGGSVNDMMLNAGVRISGANFTVAGNGGGYLHNGPMQLGGITRDYIDGPWNISLTGIPFPEYKVVLYMGTDRSGMKWGPVKVSSGEVETYYTYTDEKALTTDVETYPTWGSTSLASQYTAEEGVNVMIIPNLSGDISLLTSGNGDNVRGGLYAIQIINTSNYSYKYGHTAEDGKEYARIFYGTSDVFWNNKENWYIGSIEEGERITLIPQEESAVPGAAKSEIWDPILIDGDLIGDNIAVGEDGLKTVILTNKVGVAADHLGLEGWNLRLGVMNGVHVKISEVRKLQSAWNNNNTGWITVDETSKLTIGTLGSQSNNTFGGEFNIFGLLVVTNDFTASGNNPGYNYSLGKSGKVEYQGLSDARTHNIKSLILDLGDSTLPGKKIKSRQLIAFTNQVDQTFTFEKEGVTTTDNETSATLVETFLYDVGDYDFELKSDGYYVNYIAFAQENETAEVPLLSVTGEVSWGDAANWSTSTIPSEGNVVVKVTGDAILTIPDSGVVIDSLRVALADGVQNGSLIIRGGSLIAANFETEIEVVVELDASKSNMEVSEARREFIRSAGCKFIFYGAGDFGARIIFGQNVNKPILSHLVFDGGKHVLEYGYSSGGGSNNFGEGATPDNPTILVKNGTVVDFTVKDLSYWSGAANAKGIIRVNDGGVLNLKRTGGNATCYYRQQFYLEPGALLDASNLGENKFRLQGGSTNAASAVVYVPESTLGNNKPAVINAASGIFLAGDATRGVNIEVGEGSKLLIEGAISAAGTDANYVVYKHGAGSLEIEGDVTTPALIAEGGEFTVSGTVANLELRDGAKLSASNGGSVGSLMVSDGCAVVASQDSSKVVTVTGSITGEPSFEMTPNGSGTIKFIKVPLESEFEVIPEKILGGIPEGWVLKKQVNESILWMLKRTGFSIIVR